MKYIRLLTVVVVSVVISTGIGVLAVPITTVIENDPPEVIDQERIRLDHGLVTVEQTLVVPPSTHEVGLQLWVQHLPGHFPYLTVSASSNGVSYGPSRVNLPPVDGQFHPVQLPWWRMSPDYNKMRISLRGHGVLVSTTRDVRVEPFEANGVASRSGSLLVHIRSRQGGIERYLPLLRVAEHKPGVLGWPKALPTLTMVAIITLIGLCYMSSWLIKVVQEPTPLKDSSW
jgi:hypothetical protein